MATSSHITSRGARRRSIVFLFLASIAGAVCTAALAAGTQHSSAQTTGGYSWPIKPFDRQHPVRGVFADPRTSFVGPPTRAGLNGPGEFSFHQGVDISAPAGTAVYPVRSGRRSPAQPRDRGRDVGQRRRVRVLAHRPVRPRGTARDGLRERARPDPAGEYEHVHLTELDGGRAEPAGARAPDALRRPHRTGRRRRDVPQRARA